MRREQPLAFTYPESAHDRIHGPSGYSDAGSYRSWLRDEFKFRCVYCLARERWGKVTGEFDLEHFLPVSIDGRVRLEYDQIVYACHACNLRKGSRPLADPSRELSQESVHVHTDGRISGLTAEASRIIAVLCLDSPKCVRWRLTWMRIIELCRKQDAELFGGLMGYPDDLPDLAALKAPSNQRPEGVQQSAFERRRRAELPATYVC
jgi:hypothetical protein